MHRYSGTVRSGPGQLSPEDLFKIINVIRGFVGGPQGSEALPSKEVISVGNERLTVSIEGAVTLDDMLQAPTPLDDARYAITCDSGTIRYAELAYSSQMLTINVHGMACEIVESLLGRCEKILETLPSHEAPISQPFLQSGGDDARPLISRSSRVGPVKLNLGELFSIISLVRDFCSRVNGEARVYSESLRLKGGAGGVDLPIGFSHADLIALSRSFDDVAYKIRYERAPIADVSMHLFDTWREIEIEGTDEVQVDSLKTIIEAQLRAHVVFPGGWKQRTILGTGWFFLMLALPALANSDPSFPGPIVKLIVALLAVVGILCLWMLPWERWFPGSFLHYHDTSFLVRNAPLFTFLGLVLGLLIGMIGLFFTAYMSRPIVPQPHEGKSDHSLIYEESQSANERC